MTSLAELYRAERRRHSASMIYQEPAPQPQRSQVFVPNSYQGLGQYAQAKPSQFEQKPGESDFSFAKRLEGIGLQHLAETLPAAQLERVAASYNSAVERINGVQATHADLRQQLDQRQSGVNRGVMGSMSPQDRAAVVNASMVRTNSMSETAIAQNGGLETSVGPAPARIFASQLKQRPEHQDVSQIRSSGTGWLGADR